MTTQRSNRSTGDHRAVRTAVSNLRLSSWREVEPRLLLRTVAGAHPAETVRGPVSVATGSPLTLEVTLRIDLSPPSTGRPGLVHHAAIPLRRLPVAHWATSRHRIWQTAARNTRRLVRPSITICEAGPSYVLLLTGDHDTSGVAVDIGYFVRSGVACRRQTELAAASGWWSVLSERAAVLVVGVRPPRRAAAASLISGLRNETEDPLPSNLFRYRGLVSPGQPDVGLLR